MPKVTEGFLNDLFIVYFIVFIAAAAFGWAFQRRLKNYHPKVSAEFGTPSMFNNSISISWRSVGFLIRKRYEELNDPALNFLGQWARLGLFAIPSFIAMFFVLGIIGQVQNGVWEKGTVTTHPLNTTGALLLALVGANLAGYWLITRRVRVLHSQLWETLGRPSPFLNNTISNGFQMMGFIWSARHNQLNDNRLSIYIFGIRLITVAFVGLFFAVTTGYLQT